MGTFGLDMAVWLPVIERERWEPARAITLISALEDALFCPIESLPPWPSHE